MLFKYEKSILYLILIKTKYSLINLFI